MSIIRSACVVGVIAFALPAPPDDMSVSATSPSSLHILDAASKNFSDVKAFCAHQSQICSTADYVASRLEAKAKYGLQLIYNWAQDASDLQSFALLSDQATLDPTHTGSTSPAPVVDSAVGDLRGSIFPDQG